MNSKAHVQIFYSALQSPRVVGRRVAAGTETASDQLLDSNREKQEKRKAHVRLQPCKQCAINPAVFSRYQSFCFHREKKSRKTWKGSCVSYGHVGN